MVGETIHRLKNKTGNFTIVLNEVFRRSDLSAKAKGIYAYLMTLPDDWIIRKQELYTHFTEGRAALDTGFAELETAGYVHKGYLRDDHGHIMGAEYIVYESAEMNVSPNVENQQSVPSNVDYPIVDKPIAGNQQLLSTDTTKDLVEPSIRNNRYIKNVVVVGSSSNGAGLKKNQPTTTNNIIFNFKKECEQLGFPITEAKARSILKTGLDPAWFTGPGSFPAAIAVYINEQYPDKLPNERLKLFLSALTWEDKQDEYRDFLEKRNTQARKKAESEAERQRKEAKRGSTPRPAVCGNCGAAMPPSGDLCPACDHYAVWDDEQEKYVFQKRPDFSEFAKGFGKKHRISNDNLVGDVSEYFREIGQ